MSWWGPEWRQESHDTQGVSTDQVLPHVVAQVEQQQHLRIAFHLEPYQGEARCMHCDNSTFSISLQGHQSWQHLQQ